MSMSEAKKFKGEPSCGATALRRARQASSRSRKKRFGCGVCVFVSTFVASLASSVLSSLLVASLRWKPASAADVVLDPDRPRNAYERGDWGRTPIPTPNCNQPSLRKLVKDLQRPSVAAREQALGIVLYRIDNAETRSWFKERVGTGDFHRIRYAARPGTDDEAVLAGWTHEAATARIEAAREAEELAKEADPELKPKGPK